MVFVGPKLVAYVVQHLSDQNLKDLPCIEGKSVNGEGVSKIKARTITVLKEADANKENPDGPVVDSSLVTLVDKALKLARSYTGEVSFSDFNVTAAQISKVFHGEGAADDLREAVEDLNTDLRILQRTLNT